MPAISVLVSTYNEPQWLEWVLLGYSRQTFTDFELIVVDDGSTADTRERIDALRPRLPYALRHFWHPDRGYRKCTAMNRGIELARRLPRLQRRRLRAARRLPRGPHGRT